MKPYQIRNRFPTVLSIPAVELFMSRLITCFLQLFALWVGLTVAQSRTIGPTESLRLVYETESPPNAPAIFWNWISSMQVTKDNSFLVAFDMRPPRVTVLKTATFELVSTFGRKGKGPGEFMEFFAWIGVKDDTIFVSQGHRTARFLLDGTYLDKDILTLNRTTGAMLNVYASTGIDKVGNLFYWDARPNSDYLISKKLLDGTEQQLIKRDDVRSSSLFREGKRSLDFGVLENGSIILAYCRVPIVARYDSSGRLKWEVDMVRQIPFLRKDYDEVKAGKFLKIHSTFYADEVYTILTYPRTDKTIGRPTVYYVFLSSNTGRVIKIAYARQNVFGNRRPGDDVDESYYYYPRAIAHRAGMLYVFSYNSSSLQKYKLMWDQ